MFMIEKFKDFFKNRSFKYEQEIPKTQDELDTYLLDAIGDDSYESFVDAIERGADINKSIDTERGYLINPLVTCIMLDKIKMIKYLINVGVDFDEHYDYMMKMISKEYRMEIVKLILKKYPNFYKEREKKKDANKYNL